jgi:hypothetical protein
MIKIGMFFLCFLFFSCKKKAESNFSTSKVKENKQNVAIPEDIQYNNYTSVIRPKEKLVLGKIMTDEFEFVSYNDGGDYFYIYVKKNNEEFSLIYDWERKGDYEFKRGDIINLDWKIDSIRIAGDGESLQFTERAIKARKMKDGNVSLFKSKY